MTERLLLDEHYSGSIADALLERGHDVIAVVADLDLRGASDAEVYRWAAENDRRVVTENVKDFRPLLMQAQASDGPAAALLLVSPRRFPRGRGDRASAIIAALETWLEAGEPRPIEDWLA
ncbi:hypothetical protein BOH66_14035 [Microbacterium aurum]|uniref:DUF5615 domain-containing protein n=1 Tax=Microbacterium aurum TaxID=36805 RepID=A0A1P8UAV7_9MICO|nr:DUF5615 family PIN-like protein [Microbacterium aurum]APZ35240.1 hypothetical protein BOH66_14035 [Microbacterium aurum]MBM7829224.1 uncharacterized protein YbjT (DUF2867 family) [Microbacterium aurum]